MDRKQSKERVIFGGDAGDPVKWPLTFVRYKHKISDKPGVEFRVFRMPIPANRLLWCLAFCAFVAPGQNPAFAESILPASLPRPTNAYFGSPWSNYWNRAIKGEPTLEGRNRWGKGFPKQNSAYLTPQNCAQTLLLSYLQFTRVKRSYLRLAESPKILAIVGQGLSPHLAEVFREEGPKCSQNRSA